MDPMEDNEASEAADAIAAGCVHPSTDRCDAAEEATCRSNDFEGKPLESGLVTTGDWVLAAAREGAPGNLMFKFSALLMLHFFDGVLGADGVA